VSKVISFTVAIKIRQKKSIKSLELIKKKLKHRSMKFNELDQLDI